MDRTTIRVYEDRAGEWQARRPARFAERAEALAASVPGGELRADLGCGPGQHLPMLGRPIVALDAAFAMVQLAHEGASDAWCVQADLEALPLRRGVLHGGWARASYLHVARRLLPWALAELHQALVVGAPVDLTMRQGDAEGEIAGDDFPGRFFAEWRPDSLGEVLAGAGFTVDELAVDGPEWIHVHARRARTLPDYVAPGLRVLLVGLNPSEYAADAGVGFARPGNRFWPAALASGLLSRDRDPRHAVRADRVGMTDLVKRATRDASGLSRSEYRDGFARVERLVEWLAPRVVCFVGLAGWRAVVDRAATPGPQSREVGGAPAYVMPNPSGANAHARPADFVAHFEALQHLADR